MNEIQSIYNLRINVSTLQFDENQRMDKNQMHANSSKSNRISKIYQKQSQTTSQREANIKIKTEILSALIFSAFFVKIIENIKHVAKPLTQNQQQAKEKQLAIDLLKTYLELLKVEAFVVNNQASSLYYTENTIVIGIKSFRLIICYQLILHSHSLKLSNFTINKLRSNLQSLIIKYHLIKTKIQKNCQATIKLFETYYQSKSCQNILKNEEIQSIYNYLQEHASSYLFFIQAVLKKANERFYLIMKKLHGQMSLA